MSRILNNSKPVEVRKQLIYEAKVNKNLKGQ